MPYLSRFLFAAVLLVSSLSQAAEKPNILIILADDLGYSDIGCYGSEIATPNLDGLAKGGLRFTQFYNTARCWPTRAALMTGYYPQQIRMDPPQGRAPEWTRSLAQLLKPLGYRSYHSGKWHINGLPRTCADAGFDHSYRLEDHDRNFNPQNLLEDDKKLSPVPTNSGYYTATAFADHTIRCLKEHAETIRRPAVLLLSRVHHAAFSAAGPARGHRPLPRQISRRLGSHTRRKIPPTEDSRHRELRICLCLSLTFGPPAERPASRKKSARVRSPLRCPGKI